MRIPVNDQPYRLKVITDSGDCDHADHERLKPGVMVTALHAADISVGCMGMVGPVKSAAASTESMEGTPCAAQCLGERRSGARGEALWIPVGDRSTVT